MRQYVGIDLTGITDAALRRKLSVMDRALRDMQVAIDAIMPGVTSAATAGSAHDDEAFVVTAASANLSAEKLLSATTPVVSTVGASTVVISAPTVVVGPAVAVDNAIVRFDSTTGKLIQDYTSGAPTISDTGVVSVSAGMTITGAVTNTSTYSVGTNQSNFLSTVPATGGVDYGYDFQDTVARTNITDFHLGLRDSAGVYKFRIQAGLSAKIIAASSSVAGTLNGTKLTLQDNVTGSSVDPGLSINATTTQVLALCGSARGLLFKGSTAVVTDPVGVKFESDGNDIGGLSASDNQIIFQKTQADDTTTIPNSPMARFMRSSTYGDDRHHTNFENGLLSSASLPADGAWCGITQALRFAVSQDEFSLYKTTGNRWITVNGLIGGGYKFTDAGTTEPIT